jgi:hypothetical protein
MRAIANFEQIVNKNGTDQNLLSSNDHEGQKSTVLTGKHRTQARGKSARRGPYNDHYRLRLKAGSRRGEFNEKII